MQTTSPRARVRLPLVTSESRRAVHELVPADVVQRSSEPLADAEGRVVRYLRLSVTDRCDMACTYCMPAGGEDEHGLREELLTFEEITRLVRVLAAHGLRRVRLTGGEPLVRRDVVALVQKIRDAGIEDVWMTTNASRLAALASPLREAGLVGVNVSIDSLDPDRFAKITRGGRLASVLAGIEAAREASLALRTNTVVMRSENLGELAALARWAWSIDATPRFIELMPIGEGARLPSSERVGAGEMREALGSLELETSDAAADTDRGPARYLRSKRDPQRRVGFITAVSDEFCASCNRVRLTSQGEVRPCLASRRAVSLRELLRDGAGDDAIVGALRWALAGKGAGHDFAITPRDASSDVDHERVGMSLIGG
ncbi:MAG: GTP 3',8-cyclase MoaA [Deltaproteobacteria bacterium]|nr:GTP 3',8-cyclase MoaA [Deltaproteobacteria bacterium]